MEVHITLVARPVSVSPIRPPHPRGRVHHPGMVPVGAERRYTVEDYFSVEESSAVRHEFCVGQIFAMAGASVRHNRITGNVFALLRAALAGTDCDVFASDLRVRTPSGLYTYPDVMVVCGGVQLVRPTGSTP